MNYIKITGFDIANGPGIRVVLWLAGCEHHCPECHNANTWDRTAGQLFREEEMQELLRKTDSPHIQGVTFSGGDPLAPYNRAGVLEVIRRLRRELPGKDVWVYTGYLYEDLIQDPTTREILELADVLVDGPFIREQKALNLLWKGSANQRVIDLRKTRQEDRVCLFC